MQQTNSIKNQYLSTCTCLLKNQYYEWVATKIRDHFNYWNRVHDFVHMRQKKFMNNTISSRFEIIQIFRNKIKSNDNCRKRKARESIVNATLWKQSNCQFVHQERSHFETIKIHRCDLLSCQKHFQQKFHSIELFVDRRNDRWRFDKVVCEKQIQKLRWVVENAKIENQ